MILPRKCECGCQQITPLATRSDSRRNQVKGEPMRFMPGHNSASTKKTVKKGGAVSSTATFTVTYTPEIDQLQLFGMRDLPDAEVAAKLDCRARQLEGQNKRTFIEFGLIASEMDRRGCWKELIDSSTGNYYQSMDGWLSSAAPVSRSSAYEAKRYVEKITDVPFADLQQMPRFALRELPGLSPAVRTNPEVIEAAKTQTEDEFLGMLEDRFPGQHVERRRAMHLKPARSVRKVIDEAIDLAMALEGCKSREEALESICAEYLITHTTEMPNAEAHAHPVA